MTTLTADGIVHLMNEHWTIQYLKHVLEVTGDTPSALAKRAGLSTTTLTRPLNSESHSFDLSNRTVTKLQEITGVSASSFMDRSSTPAIDGDDKVTRIETAKAAMNGAGKRVRQVHVYDIDASAGHGSLVSTEEPLYDLPFQNEMLRTITNASDSELFVIRAKGESMLPTLTDGDMLLVDSTKRNINYDGLFILRYEDVLRVKRIDRNPATGKYLVKSDNTVYESFEVDRADLDVLGRVIWVGRKV